MLRLCSDNLPTWSPELSFPRSCKSAATFSARLWSSEHVRVLATAPFELRRVYRTWSGDELARHLRTPVINWCWDNLKIKISIFLGIFQKISHLIIVSKSKISSLCSRQSISLHQITNNHRSRSNGSICCERWWSSWSATKLRHWAFLFLIF